MHGRQYYYGLSVGAAYKFSDNFSAFAGVRGVYASTNYYGYVENIKVGSNASLYGTRPYQGNSCQHRVEL